MSSEHTHGEREAFAEGTKAGAHVGAEAMRTAILGKLDELRDEAADELEKSAVFGESYAKASARIETLSRAAAFVRKVQP